MESIGVVIGTVIARVSWSESATGTALALGRRMVVEMTAVAADSATDVCDGLWLCHALVPGTTQGVLLSGHECCLLIWARGVVLRRQQGWCP